MFPWRSYIHICTFQSTLSMRRATIVLSHQIIKITISIHALHEESDGETAGTAFDLNVFQSTLSMRRATMCLTNGVNQAVFQSTLSMRRATSYMLWHFFYKVVFQSTLSMRRATYYTAVHTRYEIFQSTLSMRRATRLSPCR